MTIAGVAIAFVWLSIWIRFRDFSPDLPPEPRDLTAWSFLGCLDIDIEAPGSEPLARDRSWPDMLMLVPDDFDEWGRSYDTYRAWPLASKGARATAGARPPSSSYRWFTRADTLWVVWSELGSSGGVALRRFGGQLTGRASLRSDSGSFSARATAWPINCHTRQRDWARPIRR